MSGPLAVRLPRALPRVVIDLTDDARAPNGTASQPPTRGSQSQGSQSQGSLGEARAPCLEPPAKRRRSENEPSGKQSLRACVDQQILPHVIQAVGGLSRDKYRIDDIAIQAVTTLARSPSFRIAVDEADGSLLSLPHARTAAATNKIVAQLKELPQYQIRPPSFMGREATQLASRPKARLPEPGELRGVSCGIPEPRNPKTSRPRHGQRTQSPTGASKWLRLKTRPYLPAAERDLVARGTRRPVRVPPGANEWPVVYHVDFTSDEIGQISACLSASFLMEVPRTVEFLTTLCYKHNVASLVGDAIEGRKAEDVRNFCSDLMAGRAAAPDRARVLSLEREAGGQAREDRRVSRVPSLLLARELEGKAGLGRTRQLENVQNELVKAHEDELAVVAEFTNCAGDVSAMSWVPEGNVVCGTTAHSDAHNQQYNKPGNLLLCSTRLGTLRAFADHRVPRPVVDKGENASAAMRRTQDPWLYASVVSSDYDAVHGRAFTSSFDGTVKVWAVARDGASMAAVATWRHDGIVNFVAAARDGSGRVASAADVPSEAVRVYTVRGDDVGRSAYRAVSCSRSDAAGSRLWAYFPATMQWGRAAGTAHLLLVGYSPRSLTHDDGLIPDDKRDSGEILLWDAAAGRRVPVMTASAANVFEVAWHPTLPRFVVATSPCGPGLDHGVRTQIHVFQRDASRGDGAYHDIQKLDCPAADINELTFVPNSLRHAYVTAACTDGNVYVWDTAQGDDAVHVLAHADPLDDVAASDRERDDTGVKFVAWGQTLDRLYTGSSDGVVKVWNVRNRRRPWVRDLLRAPGPISIGAFSPDHSKLAIGDATGRLFLLSTDRRDEHAARFVTLPGAGRRLRPTPFVPHPEPPPPPPSPSPSPSPSPPPSDPFARPDDDKARRLSSPPPSPSTDSIAAHARRTYLDTGQLRLDPSPVVGAVQGPAYAAAGLFRRDAHLDEDPSRPLLADFQRLQRQNLDASRGPRRRRSERRLALAALAARPDAAAEARHAANRRRDVDALQHDSPDVWDALVREGAVLSDVGEDWGFDYDDGPVDDDVP